MIISARGTVLAEAESGEEIIFGEVDLSERDQVRGEIPCFSDRRPEVYSGDGINPLTMNFLISKFREYYIQATLDAPPGLQSREWGFLFFDDSGMRRHKSFFSRGELVDYVRSMIPRHVYHSAAYYQRPGAPTMKEKIWQGADLIFDLDADHLRGAASSYAGMLEQAPGGRWRVSLEDERREWRLTGEWAADKAPVLQLP